MGRIIKFRAWDKENEEYRNGYEVLLKYDGSAISRYALGALDTDMPVNVIIEQYTGLKDKNGKEIYEGDILWWEHFHGMTGKNIETTAEVYWEEKDASFVVGDWFEPLGHLIDEDEVEVIGNIHENPELLGGENER